MAPLIIMKRRAIFCYYCNACYVYAQDIIHLTLHGIMKYKWIKWIKIMENAKKAKEKLVQRLYISQFLIRMLFQAPLQEISMEIFFCVIFMEFYVSFMEFMEFSLWKFKGILFL